MSSDSSNDDSLYPIAVLIDELRNEDVQVFSFSILLFVQQNHRFKSRYDPLTFDWCQNFIRLWLFVKIEDWFDIETHADGG